MFEKAGHKCLEVCDDLIVLDGAVLGRAVLGVAVLGALLAPGFVVVVVALTGTR